MSRVMPAATLLLAAGLALPAGALAAGAWKPADQPDLADRLARAADLKVEELGVPVSSVRAGMLLWAPNPGGKTYDLLQIYFPQYGGPNTIAVMDLGSGQVKTVQTERGPNFHLCPAVAAPDGKLYISILGPRLRQQVCIYDPARNELALQALPVPEDLLGETHPMTLGTDGRIYMAGGHPSKAAAALQIDPATGKTAFYGPVGPSHEPSDCWAYSVAADDTHIYISSGKVPWHLVAVDRGTGKWETLLTTERVGGTLGVGQFRYGCTASARKVVGTSGEKIDYWLRGGRAVVRKDPREPPPWDEPRPARQLVDLPPRPEVSPAKVEPGPDGRAELWYRTAEARAAAPSRPPADASLESLGWKVFRYQVPTYPQAIYRLTELPDGRLLGTAGAYQGNFVFDPARGRAEHLGKCHLSHYATAVLGGKIYMSGYPNSPLYVYDPQKPWTAGAGEAGGRTLDDADPRSNPRRLLYMSEHAGTHKMYGAAAGADGRAYFGGQWIRNGAAGGLAWYDPKTEKAGGFWEAFSNYQVTHLAAADRGRYIVISTRRIEDTLLGKPKPRQGKLFVFDTQAGRIVREAEPAADAKGAGHIVGVAGSRVLGWTENPAEAGGKSSILYGFDAATGSVEFARTLPWPLPAAIGSNQQEAWDFRLGPDGRVWTFIENRLVRIDPKDAAVEVLGKVPRGGRIAFAGNDVYLSGEPALRRIRGIGGG